MQDMLIYLKANEQIILARLRKRHDSYRDQIDITYSIQVLGVYDGSLRTYPGAYLTIDTFHLDYLLLPQQFQASLHQIQELVQSTSSKHAAKDEEDGFPDASSLLLSYLSCLHCPSLRDCPACYSNSGRV